MGSFWDQLRHLFSGPQLPWMILWLGLAALIFGLIVLTRTNWGQSHPLQKCAAMSLLVHLLLAAYATTVEIVTAGSPDGNSDRGAVSISLVNDVGEAPEQPAADKATNPWDKLLAGPATVPDAMKIEHPEPLAVETAPSLLNADPLAATKPLLDKLPSMLASLVKPAAEPAMPPAKPAEPIDAAPPPVPQKATAPQPVASAPERLSTAPNDKPAGDPETNSAVSSKPQTIVPGPDSISPPPDPTSGKPADSKVNSSSPLAPAAIGSAGTETKASTASSGNSHGADSNDSRLVMVPAVGSAAKGASDGANNGAANSGAANGGGAEPEVYRDRTASDRSGILRRRGGSPETEAAVQAALKWLVAHQSADGHWDADRYGAGRETMTLGYNRNGAGAKADTAMTGLALLALLGSGNTHRDGPYADNVRRGLNYLLGVQGSDGNLGGQAAISSTFMYSHGIASFAVSEDYAMTHDKRLETPLRAAIGYTLAAQHPTSGGWRYQPHETGDTSQLGWQLMALKSAELAGIPMPETTRAGAVRFLRSVASGSSGGLASYRPNELPSRAMTAEALVCRQFMGASRGNPSADEAGDYLLGELPNRERINLYYWYYGTLGMYQLGGEHWQRWNAALQAALLDQQRTEGDMAGSWDPKCIWGGYGGRVYSTAMSALCLEVYYRFLPLYNAEPEANAGSGTKKHD